MGEFDLGNWAQRLRLRKPVDLRVPPLPIKQDLLLSFDGKQPDRNGLVHIRPGVDIPEETLKSLAEFLSNFASDPPGKPVDLMQGFSIQTDHVNKLGRLIGIGSRLPDGISIVVDQERQFVGFTFGRDIR